MYVGEMFIFNHEVHVRILLWSICQGVDFLMLSAWGGDPNTFGNCLKTIARLFFTIRFKLYMARRLFVVGG